MKRTLLIVLCFTALMPNSWAQKQWVDLSLTSGTLWASEPEIGYYSYEEAKITFGVNVPTKWQWKELYESCNVEQDIEHGITKGTWFRAKNGNSIYIPAQEIVDVGKKPRVEPFYWTFTTLHSDDIYAFFMNGNTAEFSIMKKHRQLSVILVSK